MSLSAQKRSDVIKTMLTIRSDLAACLITLAWFGVTRTTAAGAPQDQQNKSTQAITVVALDLKNQRITEISQEEIRVRGVSAVPFHVEALRGPRRVLLLIDLSGSIRTNNVRMHNTLQAARELLKQNSEDWIAIHAFGERHVDLVSFAQGTALALKMLDTLSDEKPDTILKTYGSLTNVIPALESSLEKARPDLHFGDVIVLVSDGDYRNVDKKERDKLQMKLVRSGVRLYLMRTAEYVLPTYPDSHFPSMGHPQTDQTSLEKQLEKQRERSIAQALQDLVVPTGGAVLSPADPSIAVLTRDRQFNQDRLGRAAIALTMLIHNAYRVDLEIREPVPKPRRFTFSLEKRGSNKIHVQYPNWILPGN